MRKLRLMLLAVIVGTLCAGPALADSHLSQAGGSDAKIVDFGFSPDTLELTAGDTIEWTNTGARPHTVSDRGGTFDTGPIAPGAKDSVTFSVPGRYTFFCRINPGKMNGVIDVKVGDELPRSVRVEATDPTRDTSTPLSFTPNELEVEAGTPIVLANVGGKPHSLTADDGSFDSGIVDPGAAGGRFAGSNATVVPTKPGEFPFSCVVHPEAMKGVLTVTGEAREGPAKPAAAPNDAPIDIKDFEFDPAEASVAPGGTVTWRNTGDAPHTATFDPEVGEPLDTGTIDPGSDGSLVAPTQPGSYSYRCTIHPDRMRATLVVVGRGTADPTKANVGDEYQAAAVGTGPGGGISALALATAVAGAFLGGFGVSAFVRRKPAPAQTP